MKMQLSSLFLLVFLISMLGQSLLWRANELVDNDLWLARVTQLEDDLRERDLVAFNPVYSGHPGMAVVFAASGLHKLGFSLSASLHGGVVLFISLIVAGIATVAYLLYPKQPWWIAAGVISVFHPLYLSASPTNAVIAPVVVLIVLLGLLLYTRRSQDKLLLWPVVGLGLVVGLGMATRIPTTPLLVLPLALFLWPHIGSKRVLAVGLIAGGTMLLLDPLWWQHPIDHISFMLFRSSLNVTESVADLRLTFSDFVLFAPFSLLAIGLAALYTFMKKLSSLMPRPYLVFVFAVTVMFSLVFLSVRAQSLRHFFPLILLWEVLLPLFMLHLVQFVRFPAVSSERAVSYQKMSQYIVLGLIVGSEIFLLLFSLSISFPYFL